MLRRVKTKLVFFIIAIFLTGPLYASEIAVIVNGSGPITNISETEIRDIYLGNLRFVDKVKIVPLNYREGPVKDAFLSSIVGMPSKEYRRYWVTKSFQEGIMLPPPKTSFEEMISEVMATRGAIGYLPKSELKGTDGLKVIAIIKSD